MAPGTAGTPAALAQLIRGLAAMCLIGLLIAGGLAAVMQVGQVVQTLDARLSAR